MDTFPVAGRVLGKLAQNPPGIYSGLNSGSLGGCFSAPKKLLRPHGPQRAPWAQGSPGGFCRFFRAFGVWDHEKRVQDEENINSDLSAPPDLKIFTKFHENP